MMILLAVGLVALAVGGCVCVVWADRGGPRWVRGVAAVTLVLSDLVRSSSKRKRRRGILSGPGNNSGGADC
jgi:hypothetical protein